MTSAPKHELTSQATQNLALLGLIVTGSALAMGTVHVPVLVAIASLTTVTVLRTTPSSQRSPLAVQVLLLLAGYTLIQGIPLPIDWVATLAPANADVWLRAFRHFDTPPTRAALSLDPGATFVEALKLLTYAGVVVVARAVAAQFGYRTILRLVFFSAVSVGVITLLHALLGATKLYGFYTPRFAWQISPFLNPNTLAGYATLGCLCGLGLLLDQRNLRASAWLEAAGIASLICVTALTGSRAGIVALGAGLTLVILIAVLRQRLGHSRRRSPPPALRRLTLMFAGIALAGAAMTFVAASPMLASNVLNQGFSKLDMQRSVLPMIWDFRWLGVGRGAFEGAFPPYRQSGGHIVFTHAENFVLQFLVEWGPIIGSLALLAVLAALWPRKARFAQLPVACAYVGVVVVLAQNLLELGLEIPGLSIAICSTLGGAFEGSRRKTEVERKPAERLRLLPFLFLMGLSLLGTSWAGFSSADQDRDKLYQAFQATKTGKLSAADFFEQLKAAMWRHPGDAYLPLLGARVSAQAGTRDTLRWLAHSIERDPMNGRTHLFLATELARRGARDQALLELRLAVERDPSLCFSAGQLGSSWTQLPAELLRAAPESEVGAELLVVISRHINSPTDKFSILAAAIERNPKHADAHFESGMLLAAQLAANAAPCTGPNKGNCAERGEVHVAALRKYGVGAQWARVKANILSAMGKSTEAIAILRGACPDAPDKRICYGEWLRLALHNVEAIDEVVQQYETSCAGPTECAVVELEIAQALAGRERWGLAQPHYVKSAQMMQTPGAWLLVAEAAEKNNAYAQVALALRAVERDKSRLSGEQAARFASLKTKLAEHYTETTAP